MCGYETAPRAGGINSILNEIREMVEDDGVCWQMDAKGDGAYQQQESVTATTDKYLTFCIKFGGSLLSGVTLHSTFCKDFEQRVTPKQLPSSGQRGGRGESVRGSVRGGV